MQPPQPTPILDIPFELKSNLLVFSAQTADGQALTLTLDTCAWPHVVSTELAEAQHWLSGDIEQAEGAGGKHQTQAAVISELNLDRLKLQHLPALCDPLNGPVHFDLMLGGPLLQSYILTLDYPKRRLKLQRPSQLAQPNQTHAANSLPLSSIEPGLPCLLNQLSIQGQLIPETLIDTGNNASLVLSAELARQLGLEPAETLSGGGFGGAELTFGSLTVDNIQLAGQNWEQVQVLILPAEASPLLAAPGRALIGNALLKDSKLTLNLIQGSCSINQTKPSQPDLNSQTLSQTL